MSLDNCPDERGDEPCIPQETEIKNVKLAHAYVPIEKLCTTFTPIESLRKGTAFPPLLNMYPWQSGN